MLPPTSDEDDDDDGDGDDDISVPFFSNVDEQVNEIMEEQHLFSRPRTPPANNNNDDTLNILESLKKAVPSIPKTNPYDVAVNVNQHPQYTNTNFGSRPLYSYETSVPMDESNLMRSPRILMRNPGGVSSATRDSSLNVAAAWGEASAAAAWMPRSFYQEYVRTKGKQ